MAKIPPPTTGRGQRSPYPFKKWKVKQTKRYPIEMYSSIRAAVGYINRGTDKHWCYEQRVENGQLWVRVWRDK